MNFLEAAIGLHGGGVPSLPFFDIFQHPLLLAINCRTLVLWLGKDGLNPPLKRSLPSVHTPRDSHSLF